MAHFYGSVRGSRGEATRLGSATSGLRVYGASDAGGVESRFYVRDGEDYVRVRLTPHFRTRAGCDLVLYDGPVGRPPPPRPASRLP